jgi:hypothetical protein
MANRSDEADEASEIPEGAAVLPLIPDELGVHPLFLAMLHALVFLDGSEASIVHPEAGREALEYMATYLQRLKGPDLARLREDLDCLIRFGRQEQWDKPQLRFFKDFLATFGIEPS